MLVGSGSGGVHPWWPLETPLTDMREAAALAKDWQALIRAEWKRRGWPKLDAKHDLAAVLRVPGTFNFKYKPPRAVKLLRCEDRRTSADDFRKAIADSGDAAHGNGHAPAG